MDRREINLAERACEKLDGAVDTLAVGGGSPTSRITDAWLYNLMHLMDVHFPWPDLRERWQALRDHWHEWRDFTNDQAGDVAREIVALRHAVHRRTDEARRAAMRRV